MYIYVCVCVCVCVYVCVCGEREKTWTSIYGIRKCNSVNIRPGFSDIFPYLSKSILNSYNISHL